jgi:triosephosphate isomerase
VKGVSGPGLCHVIVGRTERRPYTEEISRVQKRRARQVEGLVGVCAGELLVLELDGRDRRRGG